MVTREAKRIREKARIALITAAERIARQSQKEAEAMKHALEGDPKGTLISGASVDLSMLHVVDQWFRFKRVYDEALREAKKIDCPDWEPARPNDWISRQQEIDASMVYGGDADMIFDSTREKVH